MNGARPGFARARTLRGTARGATCCRGSGDRARLAAHPTRATRLGAAGPLTPWTKVAIHRARSRSAAAGLRDGRASLAAVRCNNIDGTMARLRPAAARYAATSPVVERTEHAVDRTGLRLARAHVGQCWTRHAAVGCGNCDRAITRLRASAARRRAIAPCAELRDDAVDRARFTIAQLHAHELGARLATMPRSDQYFTRTPPQAATT